MSYLSPSLATLRAQVDAAFPNRARNADGWLGDAAHRARASEHNPDADGSVDGVDLTHGPAFGKLDLNCSLFVSQLVACGDPRLQRVIWNRRIWDPARGWHDYNGPNGHTHHCHAETTDAGQRDASPWNLPILGGLPTTPAAGGLILMELGMIQYCYADGREGIWWTDYGTKRWVKTTAEIEQAKWTAGMIGGPAAAAAIAPRRMELAAFDNIPVMPGTQLPPAMGGGVQPFRPATA